jgi:hypothetical protein
MEIFLSPRGGNPLHYHKRFSESFKVIEGELNVQVGKEIRTLISNDTATVPINTIHRFFNSSGKPVSVDPYINAIRRPQLGADDNQGNFTAALNAQNQAIGQVYNQNVARRDQQANSLANLEVQDGVDRITNFEKYDTKLETLNNNKELADRYKNANLGNIFNQMKYDREAKSLFNVMSDYYQINPDNSYGLKPTYKIKNGRLEPYQRNIGDLIRQSGTNANQGYMNQMEQMFKLMRQYGITSLRDVNDVLNNSIIPQRTP